MEMEMEKRETMKNGMAFRLIEDWMRNIYIMVCSGLIIVHMYL